ncbi:MAG TPA: hypothetical protein VMF31_03205 [Solirubrobacterales bacterium]|nr:hypothetical protein [Solirubrobacterales bacterium]
MSTAGFLIAVAPLLLLVAALAVNRYPGEAVIERLRSLIDGVAGRPGDRIAGHRPLMARQRAIRGGRLIGCSLAGRAPPVPA